MAKESLRAKRERAWNTYQILLATYPNADCELDYGDAFQLLIATVLSAQSTDKGVNLVTPKLFARYPDAAALAVAGPEDVETIIKATGFFRQKTKSIIGIAQALTERYAGQVPGELVELVKLPGVGRKTANVVLGHAFGIPGITTDTHVLRLSKRLGWSNETDPLKVEADLGALFPAETWTKLSDVTIWHGRRCCFAKRAACGVCPVSELCPSFGVGETDPVKAQKLVSR
ncbi:MAG: endonuclease III [Propionibacteriaceae bacterium]|jgi:endonuclease-3|nr:endonuclease III [Propionibacteriaceae bacterium]